MNTTTYERLDGTSEPVECEEDILNAEFKEMCDMIDGVMGLVSIAAFICLMAVVFV